MRLARLAVIVEEREGADGLFGQQYGFYSGDAQRLEIDAAFGLLGWTRECRAGSGVFGENGFVGAVDAGGDQVSSGFEGAERFRGGGRIVKREGSCAVVGGDLGQRGEVAFQVAVEKYGIGYDNADAGQQKGHRDGSHNHCQEFGPQWPVSNSERQWHVTFQPSLPLQGAGS